MKRFTIVTTNHVGQKYYFCYYKLMGQVRIAFVPLFMDCILYSEDNIDEAEIHLLQIKKLNNVVKYEIEEV